MRRTIYAAVLLGCLLAAGGCISYEHHITFEEDGSGRIAIDSWVPYSDDEAGTSAGGQGSSDDAGKLNARFSKELGPAFADVDGVTIEEHWSKIEGERKERREHTHVVLAFDNVERLNGHGAFYNQELTFSKKGDKFTFKQTIRNELGDEDKKTAKEDEELARALFRDYAFTFSVVMPGVVADSDGIVGEDGRTVTWKIPTADVIFMKLGYIELTAVSRAE